MKYIECSDRMQMILFPEKLDDIVSEDNVVRVIDVYIDQLNLEKMGFGKARLNKSQPGAPCYSPECLLKLYVYGYFKKIRSSRKLMEICETNVEVMWLLGQLTPDFRTIADFRKDNISAIKNVFKAFVKTCAELGLYHKEIGVQDGSKFRAVNSKGKNITESKLQKKIDLIEKKISDYLEEMDKNDKTESDPPKYTKEEMQEKIEKLRERKEQHNNLLKEMKEENETQKSYTDPDSRLMKTANGGFDVCYNTQIIVDPKSHIVGVVEVTNQCNDFGQLAPVTESLKKDLDIDVMEVTADKGFVDKSDMLECLMNGTIPHVPLKADQKSHELELDYKETVITEEMINSTKPENLKTCLESGILPNVYEGKGIEVSVYEVNQCVTEENNEDNQSHFTLNEDGLSVTCPNGEMLNKVSRLHNKGKTRFANRSACKGCEDKCTTSEFKQIDMSDGQKEVTTKKFRKVKKVGISLTPDMEKLQDRKCVVEHPFGTVKRWNDGSYTLLTGKEKVGADLSLLFLAYNIKRVINILGVPEMLKKMKEIGGIMTNNFSIFFRYSKNLKISPSRLTCFFDSRTVWPLQILNL